MARYTLVFRVKFPGGPLRRLDHHSDDLAIINAAYRGWIAWAKNGGRGKCELYEFSLYREGHLLNREQETFYQPNSPGGEPPLPGAAAGSGHNHESQT